MIRVCAAIIIHNDRILITQRSKDMKQPMSWEFPGGKIDGEETMEECIKREIKEELGIEIKVIKHFYTNFHRYDFGDIELISFLTSWESGEILLKEHANFLWVKKEDLTNFKFAPADIPIVERLIKSEI